MAFNITGFVSLSTTVPRVRPNIPFNLAIEQIDATLARLTWEHLASVVAPHIAFCIEISSDDLSWTNFATTGPNEFSLDITGVNDFLGTRYFRVIATGSGVGDRGLNSDPSDSVRYDNGAIGVPTNIVVSALEGDPDACTIAWDYVETMANVTHFDVQCLEHTTNTPTDIYDNGAYIIDDDRWRTVGTQSNTRAAAGSTTSAEFIRTGYSGENNFIFYRVRAVTAAGEVGEFSSDLTDPFEPITPAAIGELQFVRTGLNLGELRWQYDFGNSPIRTFLLEAREGITGDFAPLATLEAGALTTTEITDSDALQYFYERTGFATENDQFQYQITPVGLNSIRGSTIGPVTFTPVNPNPPTDLTGIVNSGVGALTSLTLSWTNPSTTTDSPDNFTTPTANIILEYRKVSAPPATFEQIGLYSPDVTEIEIVPPQQGPIEVRLVAQGQNELCSVPSNVASFNVPAGSATDDAIYNGDGAFISEPHFSVNDDDQCMQQMGFNAALPELGLDATTITGGTVILPTATTPGSITGAVDTQLVFEWVINVPANAVDRRRHYYLNLDNVISDGGATRDWNVDTGNVIVEVLASPTTTNRIYQGPATRLFYVGDSGANPTARFFNERHTGAADSPMYVSREQIRLPLRRSFTFRRPGFNSVRLIFLPDDTGFPVVPIPIDGTGDNTNSICMEAYAKALTESRSFALPVATGTLDIDFEHDYEEIPMITATADEPCIVWITNKNRTSATINAVPIPGMESQVGTVCNIDLTIRGY